MEIIISHAYRGHIKVASVNGMLKNNPCDLCCVQVLKTSSFSNLFISYLLTVILLIAAYMVALIRLTKMLYNEEEKKLILSQHFV